MRLLDTSGRRRRLARLLGGDLLARGLATRGFTCDECVSLEVMIAVSDQERSNDDIRPKRPLYRDRRLDDRSESR